MNLFKRVSKPIKPLDRESEADAMLGHTTIAKGTAVFLTMAFLVSILAVGFARTWTERRSSTAGGEPLEAVRPYAQLALSRYLKASNAQVDLGQYNWLFYRLGVQYVTGPAFLDPARIKAKQERGGFPDPRPAILDFKRQLAARGISLMLLPVPDKTSIYPEKLWPAYDPSRATPQNLSFSAWKREMRAAGVTVYDATDLLVTVKTMSPEALYVPTDSHWTPRAVQVCAQGLAGWIKGCGVLPEAQPEAMRAVKLRASAPRDLVKLLGLPADQNLFQFPSLPVRGILDARGKAVAARRDADVLLLGDSFSGEYRETGANLSGQLAYELGRPVDCLAVPNGGSWAARFKLRDLMKEGDDRLAGKKLVVWEFTARDLSSGDWKLCQLPPDD